MTVKNLKIQINSIIENLDASGLSEGDAEREAFSADALYEYDGEGAVIRYTERREGGDVSCTVSVSGEEVKVERRGAVECTMLFGKSKTYCGIYRVPPFSFDISISTKRLEVSFGEDGGTLILMYGMNIGGQDKLCKFKLRA